MIGGAVAAPATSTLLVAEIRDVDGNVLYRAEPVKRVVTSPASGAMTADILRNVVKYGTGKRALDAIQVRGADGVEFALPIGGKTGTTNDYKNAAFIGYAPKASADGFHVEDALFVGVYVGYDDNRFCGAAVFGENLYVLDAQTGQVWKHEGGDARFGPGLAFLAPALPPNAARSVAVDGAVWITDQSGAILQYRRSPLAATATRVDFPVRWQGEPVRASAVQAIDAQRAIYVLDAAGRTVVQITRDGRETARAALPATLPEATAFVVVELARGARVVTAHGGRIVATDLGR